MIAERSREISNNLKKKFLYDNDLNSIHLLMNIYESENNIGLFIPRYISLNILRSFYKRNLRNRTGKDLTAKNISEMIHDDINRFELLLYLEAYKTGFSSSRYVNDIEKIILDNCSVESIYCKNYVHKKINTIPEMLKIKEELFSKFKGDLRKSQGYHKLVNAYVSKIIREKIYSINDILDKQIIMQEGTDGKAVLKYEAKPFTKAELKNLYIKTSKFIFDDGIRTLANAYWTGLIEKVLRRYR